MKKILYSKTFKVDTEQEHNNLYNALYSIKRDLILFDQIVFPNLDKFCEYLFKVLYRQFPTESQIVINELQSLKEQGYIRDFKFDSSNLDWQKTLGIHDDGFGDLSTWASVSMLEVMSEGFGELERNHKEYIKKMGLADFERVRWSMLDTMEMAKSLLVTKALQKTEGLDVIDSKPVQVMQLQNSNEAIPVDRHNAFCFILGNLPLPSDKTPWSEIINFKTEKENSLRLQRLRHWMGKTLKENSSIEELRDEYELLYNEFDNAINRHRLKKRHTNLKVYLSAAPTILIELFKGKFEKLTELLYDKAFEATMTQIDLSEAEASATGKEIAYTFYSVEKFGK